MLIATGRKYAVLFTITSCLLFIWLEPANSQEQSSTTAQQTNAELIQKAIEELEEKVKQNPSNLDTYFNLATFASKAGLFKKAEVAYLHILERKPGALRVKLDLGLLYIKMNKPAEAKRLFEDVLAANPPENVQNNIELVLEVANKMLQKHSVSGNISVGMNHDTNANAAAASGEITFIGISIPLANASQARDDVGTFITATAAHSYKMDVMEKEKNAANWKNSLTVYRTEQKELDSLDIDLITASTGPEILLNKGKSKANLSFGYSYIRLDDEEYLKIPSLTTSLNQTITDKFSVSGKFKYEHRQFVNPPTSTTITDRTGNASEGELGFKYSLTPKDLIGGGTIYRQEGTRRAYYDNTQLSIKSNYTRVLPADFFSDLSFNYKTTKYDGADRTVDPRKVRKNQEKVLAATLGRKIDKYLTISSSFQFKKVDSNIQNYAYKSQKLTVNASLSF